MLQPADWRALHGGILLFFYGLCRWLDLTAWPWFLLVPLAAYLLVAALVRPLRQTISCLDLGRFDGFNQAIALGIIGLSTGALLVFDAVIRPDVTDLAARMPLHLFGNVLLSGACFALLNATLEELFFRGVLFDALDSQIGLTWALLVQAVAFGVGHVNGYPPGPFGAVLAGIYGLLLGVLRWQARGIGLAIVAHIVADATIFGILVAASEPA
jgi:membrane protease YdiL (CAAX protease family)